MGGSDKRVAELLQNDGLLTADELADLQTLATENSSSLVEELINSDRIDKDQLGAYLARHFKVPFWT